MNSKLSRIAPSDCDGVVAKVVADSNTFLWQGADAPFSKQPPNVARIDIHAASVKLVDVDDIDNRSNATSARSHRSQGSTRSSYYVDSNYPNHACVSTARPSIHSNDSNSTQASARSNLAVRSSITSNVSNSSQASKRSKSAPGSSTRSNASNGVQVWIASDRCSPVSSPLLSVPVVHHHGHAHLGPTSAADRRLAATHLHTAKSNSGNHLTLPAASPRNQQLRSPRLVN